MSEQQQPKTVVIGGREMAIIIGALALLSLAAALLVLGIGQLGQQGRPDEVIVTTTSSVPTAGAVAEQTILAQPPTQSAQIAPTLAPTATLLEHTVQAGESLTSIAFLYHIDLQTLLTTNGLNGDSVIIPGQKLIVPLAAGNEGTYHEVAAGEVLALIAQHYGVTIEAIQQANGISDANSLYEGQRLFIPGSGGITATPATPTATVPPTPTSAIAAELLANGPIQSEWPRSMVGGNPTLLEDNYPLKIEEERFTLHYQPGTYAAQHTAEIVTLVKNGLANAEDVLRVKLSGKFDMYVAGTLFEEPNASLRGMSESRERRVFILHDGSGSPVDNAYFFTHEITHMVAWNTWGQPSTAMLSEGLATWAGRATLEDGGFIPYEEMCAAIFSMGQMPSMAGLNADFQAFKGHIRDPFNYFGSACFIGYLIHTYGIGAMSFAYHSGDYNTQFGKSLDGLNQDYRNELGSWAGRMTLDKDALRTRMSKVSEAYAYVFANYNGTETMHLAYAAVDRARVALWRGEFAEVDRWLQEFTTFSGFRPS